MNGASPITKDTKFSTDNQPATGASNTKRRIMTDALMISLNREVAGIVGADGKPTKRLSMIADKLTEKASEGDTQAIKEVFDRTEGKAAQAIIHQGDEDNPLVYSNMTDAQIEAKITALLGD